MVINHTCTRVSYVVTTTLRIVFLQDGMHITPTLLGWRWGKTVPQILQESYSFACSLFLNQQRKNGSYAYPTEQRWTWSCPFMLQIEPTRFIIRWKSGRATVIERMVSCGFFVLVSLFETFSRDMYLRNTLAISRQSISGMSGRRPSKYFNV